MGSFKPSNPKNYRFMGIFKQMAMFGTPPKTGDILLAEDSAIF